MRRIVVWLALIAAFGLAGCGVRVVAAPTASHVTLSPQLTTQPTVPPVQCSAEGIRFALVSTDAAMGLRVLAFDVVNCGLAPIMVDGYPDVRLFDEDHHPVTATVEHGDGTIATVPEFDNPPGQVTLAPGEHARSGLLWRNLVTDSDLDKVVTGHFLEARGGGTSWLDVPMFLPNGQPTTVDLGNTDKVGVQAWKKA